MKPLADCLRRLRRGAGSPSYRALGRLVHVEQQSLSQTANGSRVGWGRVLLYVEALRAYDPRAVTPDELAELKALHDAGEHQYQLINDRGIRHRQSTALWQEIDSTTALSAHTAALNRAPGRWDTTRGVTDVRQLNRARDLIDLCRFLVEVADARGVDLGYPGQARRPLSAFSWFGDTPAMPAPAVPKLQRPQDLTLPLLIEIVRLCGGTDGDCQAWQSAWERIHRTVTRNNPGARPGSNGRVSASDGTATIDLVTPRLPRDSGARGWPGRVLRRPAALGYVTSL